MFLDKPIMVFPRQLRYDLPCADALWQADTAEKWLALQGKHPLEPENGCPAANTLDNPSRILSAYKASGESDFAATVL